MPSLRKRVSSYFRQLSFHNEPRDRKRNVNENSFINKYLEGHIALRTGAPDVFHGKNPTDLPNFQLAQFEIGPGTIIGCYTGPMGGLTTVKRTEKHLSVPDADIDFIDTSELNEEQAQPKPNLIKKSPLKGGAVDNTTMMIKVAGQEYCVTNRMKKRHTSGKNCDSSSSTSSITSNDEHLPQEWSRKTNFIYGISDSLYDKNMITNVKNGQPIADCFGIIARKDSAILAVADGVNWGEKASIAAKSAVHGCIHYLNKTIFNDTKPFKDLTENCCDETINIDETLNNKVKNTREIFICLLRAFNCAHDLILENDGMLTTLTVAVILPINKTTTSNQEHQQQNFICCCCNVGDSLAYVYSIKYGLRELTKFSHDVNCNRDMRDALGALGPVNGIKPDLGNLTLSLSEVQKGDIIFVASDGLTDNFDPTVCRFTVNSSEMKKEHKVNFEKKIQHPNSINNNPSTSSSSSCSTSKSSIISKHSLKTENIKQNELETNYKKPLKYYVETKTSNLRRQNNETKLNLPLPSSSTSTTTTTTTTTLTNESRMLKPQRSKTSIDMRHSSMTSTLSKRNGKKLILRNVDGLPYVLPFQRYELQLLLIEDILLNGINGREKSITTAMKLCENLLNFTFSITSAKRHLLQDNDLYYDTRNDGVFVELSQQERKIRRRKRLDDAQQLPGKLDHVTIVAWNVANYECAI